MKSNLHLSLAFNGQCEAAFRFYERSLNGTVTFMLTWGKSPSAGDAPAGWEAKIYHATLKVGDAVITGADVLPKDYEPPKGFSLIFQTDDARAAENVFRALSENGRIQMPLQKTFWASRFGALVDQFGIAWTINCEPGVESEA